MARMKSPAMCVSPLSSLLAVLSISSLLIHHLSLPTVAADFSHFEGFDPDEYESPEDDSIPLTDPLLRNPQPPTLTLSEFDTDHGPPDQNPQATQQSPADLTTQETHLHPDPPATPLEYWDEDEFEGLPVEHPTAEALKSPQNVTSGDPHSDSETTLPEKENVPRSYSIEITSGLFLIVFIANYFIGKRQNEDIALAWVSKFAVRGSIFDKNFSLLGVGGNEDSPLLLKEGQNVFKFYASGRRYCKGLLATMDLKSRHDLLSRLFSLVLSRKDEITFQVYMNDDTLDDVIFAMAKKKTAKAMHKGKGDLHRFASLVSPATGRKWIVDDLAVLSESKEVAGDLLTDAVLEQVFGDKAFAKYGRGFVSMHFSDHHSGLHKKMLVFKFSLPSANRMDEMSRLVALVPYYIDLIGRYKPSSQARSKIEAARQKLAQEAYKELQNARRVVMQQKKAEHRKLYEETEAKLSVEAIRKKDAKEYARQMKKVMPRMKMTRGSS